MRIFFLTAAIVLCSMGAGSAAQQPQSAETAAVLQAMDASAAAWNHGDLKAFMACTYEHSPQTVFLTPHGIVAGYDAIEQRYLQHYGGQPQTMGTLRFADLVVRPVSDGYAMVYGSYHLRRAGQAEAAGVFDLLLHHTGAGWRAVSDHSSSS